MNSHLKIAGLTLALAVSVASTTARAQGSLTPPGAPAPTMITLSQIEPRTPISTVPVTITQPGAYYLTTNVFTSGNGVDIEASGVTLDLNGFAISSTATGIGGFGVIVGNSTPRTNVTILNGFIISGVTNNGADIFTGNGFNSGITGANSANVQVRHVSVSGCLGYGIGALGPSSVVESCTVDSAGSDGIISRTISDCVAVNCGSFGMYGLVVNNCYATAWGTGISTTTANNCYAKSLGTSDDALDADSAFNCYAYAQYNGDGINATQVLNCEGGSGSDGIGISASAALNSYGVSYSNAGINASIVQSSYGFSQTSYGITSSGTAVGCIGNSFSGTGLSAFIAEACHGITSSGTTTNITHNVNSF